MAFILYTLQDGSVVTSSPSTDAVNASAIEDIAENQKPTGATWEILQDGETTTSLDAKNAAEASAATQQQAKSLRDKKISLKVCIDAGTTLGYDMSAEQAELDSL